MTSWESLMCGTDKYHGSSKENHMPEVLQVIVLLYTGVLLNYHFYRWLNPITIKIKK